jgi:subtilisin family serine protease
MDDSGERRRSVPRGAVILVTALFAIGVVTVGGASAAPAPPGRYIVVLREDVPDPGAVALEHARDHAAQVDFVYRSALKGYAAVIPNDRVAAVRGDGRVAYVEPDQTAVASAQVLPWGIDKVDADVSSTTAGDGAGAISNVNAYVIDTGISTSHPDLFVVDQVKFGRGPKKDCNGHGTHVAGTIAARDNTIDVVGVSPGSPLTSVKVLGCDGSGFTSTIIAGVDWVTANALKPAVANMSLGGPSSPALDTAVLNSVASGVFYAVAAGNEGANACNVSPARAGAGLDNGIVTVAATDPADQEPAFSNFGACVDIWAPGVNVLSTSIGGGTTTLSGTSQASPHVAGGGSLYVSSHTNANPAAVETALKVAAHIPGTLSKDGRPIQLENVATF